MPRKTKPKCFAVVRPWKKWMGVGCSHGAMMCTHAATAAIEFKEEFKPDKTIHFGDVFDTAAWRSGAAGTADEAEDVGDDIQAGLDFLSWLEPDLLFLGNHDIRPWQELQSPRAIVRHAARSFTDKIVNFVLSELKCDLVESYDITQSWRMLGDTIIGHGFMYNENAIRDHAEHHGRSCIIAHLHRQGMEQARTATGATGYCIGYLGDPEKFSYANRNRAKAKWNRGWAYGEYTDNETIVNLYNFEKKCPKKLFLSA